MTSSVDNRSGVETVASKTGLHHKAELVNEDLSLFNCVSKINKNDVESGSGTVVCILIDGVQFLKKHHVLECARIVDGLEIPVMVFDLKSSSQNHLFGNSKNLLVFTDKIEEMRTICHYCGHKATVNLRINSGKPVYESEQVQIGGDEFYYPACRFRYFHPDKQR